MTSLHKDPTYVRVRAIGPVLKKDEGEAYFMELQVFGEKALFLRHSFQQTEDPFRNQEIAIAIRREMLQFGRATLNLSWVSEWRTFIDFMAEQFNVKVPADLPCSFYEPPHGTTWLKERA